MEFNAFNARLGLSQGRIQLNEDEHVFVLGDDQPVYFYHLNPGDHADVGQATDLTDIDLIRLALTLSVPDELPANLIWEVSIVVDGLKYTRATCRPGRTREISDLAANVSKISGIHKVAVRLQLVEV